MKKTFYIIMAIYIVLFAAVAKAQNISTFAGNYSLGVGYTGDGGAATAAKLYNPNGIAMDRSGNIYIADYSNNVIRRVNIAGIISTFAGTGSAGYTGDGGAATAATFDGPWGLAVDRTGNLFVADHNNHVIRKISTSGTVTTYAGNHTPSYSGDGSAATAASMYNPAGICIDTADNIYIADNWNHAIRKVNTAGIISTVAGNGTAGYTGDGSAATAAKLNYPFGVAITKSGKLYIADYMNYVIREVTSSTGNIATVAGDHTYGYGGDGGVPTFAQMSHPVAVAIDPTESQLYISDQDNNRVRMITNPPNIETRAGNGTSGFSGDGGAAISAKISWPSGICFDPLGNMYLCDKVNQVIRKVAPTPITVTAGTVSFCVGASATYSTTVTSGSWSSSDGSVATVDATTGLVTAVAIGTAYIYFSDGLGLGVVAITVGAAPAAITGAAALCAGSTLTLADATPGGSWTSGSSTIATIGVSTGIVSGIAGGAVTITYTAPGGCHVTATITVNPMPDAGTITGTNNVCETSTITIANAALGGTWSSSDAAIASISTAGVITGVSAGTATITYTVTNSCGTATATYAVTVNSCPTGIRPVSAGHIGSVDVFPNPVVAGNVTVNVQSEMNEQVHIIITNILGEKIKEVEAVTNNRVSLDLNVAAGVYFLSAISDNGRYQAKIIVQ